MSRMSYWHTVIGNVVLTRVYKYVRHMKAAGSEGLVVDPSRIVWTPFDAERELQQYRH